MFTVHATLSEIELAGKALHSYVDLVTRGNARVEKSGKKEVGLDDDGTALLTVAAGITTLCVYGRRENAKRSQELIKLAEQWLQKHQPDDTHMPVRSADDLPRDLADQPRKARAPVSRLSLASTHRAIGLSQANWSRQTYQPAERDTLQANAISSLLAAAQLSSATDQDLQTSYNLALAYANKRDVDAAIASIKKSLSSSSAYSKLPEDKESPDLSQPTLMQDSGRRRTLLRCWHLLALLLTAKENFSAAVESCEAGFELYGGDPSLLGEYHSFRMSKLGLFEKENIIELKMTELALTEIIEGPEVAVNASGELLALYAKFFEQPEPLAPTSQTIDSASPPESANGGLRSFRNSIFGRSKNSMHRRSQLVLPSGTGSAGSQPSPLEKSSTPAIQLAQDGAADRLDLPVNGHTPVRVESRKLHKRQSRKSMGGSVRKSRTSSPARLSTARSTSQPNFNLPSRSRPTTATEESESSFDPKFNASNEVGVAVSHNGPSSPSIPSSALNGPATAGSLPARSPQNYSAQLQNVTESQSEQTTAAGSILHQPVFPPPEIFFPPHETTRHSLTLIVKIWVLISSLYRLAYMTTEASAALAEAYTHVRTIETIIAQHYGSSDQSFATPGWSGVKAVAELWADVYTEEAMQALAKGQTREASDRFEEALLWWPDHPSPTVGLCNILLDFYEGPSATQGPEKPSPISTLRPPRPPTPPTEPANPDEDQAALLSRLAARDRAYGLLSALTKSGQGWDCGEAWMALARAYELGDQKDKALEALWWVVELEDSRGVRGWEVVGGW